MKLWSTKWMKGAEPCQSLNKKISEKIQSYSVDTYVLIQKRTPVLLLFIRSWRCVSHLEITGSMEARLNLKKDTETA